ncbi:MAG: ERCC4 domain-containing protein [Eubacteriales bacterium]|jgi:hypothetical protein
MTKSTSTNTKPLERKNSGETGEITAKNPITIQIDSREKKRAIMRIVDEFKRQNIKHFTSKLYVGDYMSLDNPRLVIDRKQNLLEVYGNLCQGYNRFMSELDRAANHDIKIIILCEHGRNVKTIEDVKNWYNPRLDHTPYAWDGERLYRMMKKFEANHNTEFLFCEKAQTGKRIIELLTEVET